MGNDVQAWRAHIGMFNGSCKNIHSVKKSHFTSSIFEMFPYKLFLTFSFSVNAMGSLVAHCCLLILLLIEICTAFVTKRPSSNNNLCKRIMLQSLCNPCLVAFLSILMRMLLLRSGNVESNPGPRSNSFSIGCWNVDSLLTREGVKKRLPWIYPEHPSFWPFWNLWNLSKHWYQTRRSCGSWLLTQSNQSRL